MMISGYRFNSYLLLALAVLLGATQAGYAKSKKAESTLRVHLEINRDGTDRCKTASVFREKPFQINIDRSPFLTEVNVAEAKVVEVMGGFAIRIDFDRRGTWLLEQYSVSNKGRRFAIFCTFTVDGDSTAKASAKDKTKSKEEKAKGEVAEGRWLAAPIISQKISDGTLIFTPDASREEANQIVLGLNNAAKKYQSDFIK